MDDSFDRQQTWKQDELLYVNLFLVDLENEWLVARCRDMHVRIN